MITVWRRPIQASVESNRGSMPPELRSTRWPGVRITRALARISRAVAVSIGESAGTGLRAAPRYWSANSRTWATYHSGVVVSEDRAVIVARRAAGLQVARGRRDRV